MTNDNIEFYYKQVEEALANIHCSFKELLKDLETYGISDEALQLPAIPEKIEWSKHESVVGLSLKEEDLSDEQKEEIALGSRETLDKVISLLNYLVRYNRLTQDFDSCVKKFIAIIMEASQLFMSIDKREISKGEGSTALTLTHEELYYAFSFLNEEQIRESLYGQQPVVVDKLFSVFQAQDLLAFREVLDGYPISPMYLLKYLLIEPVNRFSSFSDFVKTNALINSPIMSMTVEACGLTDDVLDCLDTVFQFNNLGSGFDLSLFQNIDLEKMIDFRGKYLASTHKLFLYTLGLPRVYRRKLVENYNEWRKEYPEAPEMKFSEEADIDIDNAIRTTSVIIDKWLINAIHKKMKLDNRESSIGAELMEKQSTASNLRRLPFPSRIINNKIDGLLSNKILLRLHKAYGGYLTTATGRLISEEEFVYLFSGGIKCPSNYNPPYYWNADENLFAGLVRLLYDGQEKGIDYIILLPSDIESGKSSVKWSGKKQGLGKKTLAPIENTIQTIVEELSGKRLREVDLKRQR